MTWLTAVNSLKNSMINLVVCLQPKTAILLSDGVINFQKGFTVLGVMLLHLLDAAKVMVLDLLDVVGLLVADRPPDWVREDVQILSLGKLGRVGRVAVPPDA